MVGVLTRMKWTVFTRSLTGYRLVIVCWQLAFALAAIVVTLLVAGAAPDDPAVASQLVALAVGIWTLGWALGPTLFGGEDPTLRPEYFRMIPTSARRLGVALVAASVVGIAVPTSLVALLVIPLYAGRFGTAPVLVGAVAVVLQLVFAMFLSRVVTSGLRELTRSQLSSLLSSLVTGAVAAFFVTGWWALGAVDAVLADGLPGWLAATVHALPSGWGVLAVARMADGDALSAIGLLLGLAALTAVTALAWSRLLAARLTGASSRPSRTGGASPLRSARFATPLGAVVAKELTTWLRDYTRGGHLYFALTYSIFLCLYPAAVGVTALLPFAGILFAATAAGSTANAYGTDGTALWQTLSTPGATRLDVTGRQLAWLLTVGPPVLLMTVVLALVAGYPEALAATTGIALATLGAGAGVTVLLSVFRVLPMTDPHVRGDDMFEHGIDWAQFMIALLSVALLVSPVAALSWFAAVTGSTWLLWSSLPVGLGLGALWPVLLGRAAGARLERRGPEVLGLMRRGTASATSAGPRQVTAQERPASLLPRGKQIVMYNLFWLAPVALFPQGLVAMVLKLQGSPERVWFLALYLPQAWQWPGIIVMIASGLGLFAWALLLYRESRGRPVRRETSGRQPVPVPGARVPAGPREADRAPRPVGRDARS